MPSALETIASCSLFESLSAKDRGRLAQDLQERRFAPGETITGEDTGGVAFFLLGEGTARVAVDGVDVGSLGPGDTFGEIALLSGGNRSAAVTAEGDVQCWTLSQWHFKPLLVAHPEVAWTLLQRLAQRAADERERRLQSG
jgi:CRP-like cAMP-binding protein